MKLLLIMSDFHITKIRTIWSLSIYHLQYQKIISQLSSGHLVAVKSTIAKLISRYWDVTSGEITIGGINIKDIESKQLNDLVGFVGQDNFLF